MHKSNLVKLLHANHPEAAPQSYKDKDAAFVFLKEAARIKSNMAHFAELWDGLKPRRLKGRDQKDRDVLKGLAELVAKGDLRLRARYAGGGRKEDETPRSDTRGDPLPPKRMYTPGLGIRDRPEPTAPAAPVAPLNVDQQVAALLAAARSGVPFVEQCR